MSLIFRSRVMKNLMTKLKKAAALNIPIFLEGETGVGKNYVAEMIHDLNGGNRPFVTMLCGGLPETLLESELFGYEKGAFTGAIQRKTGLVEAARGGTLFLDEVENLSVQMQIKLLRLLDEKKFRRLGSAKEFCVNFNLISASNRSIAELVQTGEFREDLYYRMVGLQLIIPPLRERREDILPLANAFLEQHQHGKKLRLSEKAMNFLLDYPWPGNIRELKSAMGIVAGLNQNGIIEPKDFNWSLNNGFRENKSNDSLAAVERNHISKMLKQNNGSRTRTAKILGITETTLRNKIKKYRIEEAAGVRITTPVNY